MSPEDRQALIVHGREIAKIYHGIAPQEEIKTLEGIKKTVRSRLIEHVNPEIALFLSKPKQESHREEKGKSSVL